MVAGAWGPEDAGSVQLSGVSLTLACMAQPPVSAEVGGALARYFHGGNGPSHAKLTTAFATGGYGDADPYDISTGTPNKETRVNVVIAAAVRRPDRAKALIEALLVPLRVDGYFDRDWVGFDAEKLRALQRALRRTGWNLTDDGTLVPLGAIDLTTGGREALDEQIDRLRRSTGDPGALLGSAKDLLEAVAKFVLEEENMPQESNSDFNYLWHLARERLGLLPQQGDQALPGAAAIHSILQSSWKIAEQTNVLRGLQGVGHGRTLPTGVSAELALLVVREACSTAEYVLTTLDRQHGRRV